MKKLLKQVKDVIRLLYGRLFIVRDGFWFIDIPRTSSSSVRLELGEKFGRGHGKVSIASHSDYRSKQVFLDHMTAKNMKYFVGEKNWNKIFTFTIVRNPWDRTCSMYHYRKKVGDINPEWSFRDYILKLKKAKPDTKYFEYHGYRFGASDYVLGDDGEVIVDFIARYENRANDLKYIANRLNIEFDNLGELKILAAKPKGMHYSELYDVETENIIREVYFKDIELFGYKFEDRKK